jgi:hypothetical protein
MSNKFNKKIKHKNTGKTIPGTKLLNNTSTHENKDPISINKNISTSTQLLNLKKILKNKKRQNVARTNSSSSIITSTKSSKTTSKYKKQFEDFEPIIEYVKKSNNLKSNRIAVRFTNIAFREYKKVKNDATTASFNDFILENNIKILIPNNESKGKITFNGIIFIQNENDALLDSNNQELINSNSTANTKQISSASSSSASSSSV